MRGSFDRATVWFVDRPRLVSFIVLAVTGISLIGYWDPNIVRRWYRDLFAPRRNAESALAATPAADVPDVKAFSISEADAIVLVESDSIFTPAGATALREIVDEIESLEHVKSVLWMDRVPMLNIFGLPEPLFPSSRASAYRFAAAREKALNHPLIRGQFVSPDARHLLLMVTFDWFFVGEDRDCIEGLLETANQAAARHPEVSFSFGVTGHVPLHVTMLQQHEANSQRFQIIGYTMLAVMAAILFRGVVAVMVVAIAPALGVFWTLGMIRFFRLQMNPFNDVVLPVMLSLVGLTDAVHLLVQIRRLRVAGAAPREAAREGIREVGMACFLTSLTTAIGFGSLGWAHHRLVREFGWSCVLGVVLTFIAVIAVIPLACSTWLGRYIHLGHDRDPIGRRLDRIRVVIDLVLRYPRRVAAFGIGITIVATALSLTLRPDERFAHALPQGCEAAETMSRIDRIFGGLEVGNIVVSRKDKGPTEDPRILEVVSRVDDILRQESLIGHPLSIRNLLDALPGTGATADRMSLLELLPPPLKRAFYLPEQGMAEIMFRVQDLGIAKYGPVFERIQQALKDIEISYPEFDLAMSGPAVWRWENLYQIVVDLTTSLGSAALIIFGVLTIVYRSLRIGLISVIPNIFPLAITGAWLSLSGQSLEVVSVCAFTICLGIVVDDTIHFLTRFQSEQQAGHRPDVAISNAFTSAGAGMIMTTLILVAGFSTVMLSGMRDQRIFAAMGTISIATALLGDLILLPALLAVFAREK